MKSIALILLSLTLAIGGQFLLKSGMNQVGRIGSGDVIYYKAMMLKTFTHPYVLLGLLSYVLSSISWLVVLSRVNLSFAYPFAGLGYVIVMFISWRFLNEPLSAVRLLGAILICLGVFFISRG
ncbi:MAG: EamA family transporter [Actinomycetota bacterium]|nr:EamA family transporter [Actinomycetota bacterium]